MTETILIVDDIDANLYLLRTILSHNGYNVIEAKNGKEALNMALESTPAMIISDILMPIMDGFAFCKACKQDEVLKNIPFVFYTATYTEQKDAEFALSLGADRFLVKPMESHLFLNEVVDVAKKQKKFEQLTPAKHGEELLDSDEEFYKVYNTRLIHKLEDKLVELEIQNGKLLEKEKVIHKLNEELEGKVKKRTKELSLLNEDLEAFNASVSHDLRAPLRHMIGFSEILVEEHSVSLNGEAKELLNRIQFSGQKMNVMIHALLRLSHLSSVSLNVTHVNLSRVTENISVRLAEENKNVDFNIQQGLSANCDEDLLQIVLDNLLDNACKFSSKKDVAEISVGCQPEDGQDVFFVKDNGAGFSLESKEDLFKPFRRLHSSSEFEGTGIGLATVKRIITHHNGKVWAESKPQEGASFYFTLKIKAY